MISNVISDEVYEISRVSDPLGEPYNSSFSIACLQYSSGSGEK